MSKLTEFQQLDSLSVDELFAIKGGCDSTGMPICDKYVCESSACGSHACESNSGAICGTLVCESCACESHVCASKVIAVD